MNAQLTCSNLILTQNELVGRGGEKKVFCIPGTLKEDQSLVINNFKSLFLKPSKI